MRPEEYIEQEVVRRAYVEHGIQSLKLNLMGNVGWPDRLFLLPGGRPLLVEFKAPGEEPRPRQQHNIDYLKTLNYDVQVHDDIDRALAALRAALAQALGTT